MIGDSDGAGAGAGVSSGSEVLAVREARPGDLARREELVRRALAGYHIDAFLYFFFQELTLQCSVVSGALLFIFCGVWAGWCCVAVPATAVCVVGLAVWGCHMVLADKLLQGMRREMVGLVAVYCGPSGPGAAGAGLRPAIQPLYAQEHTTNEAREPAHTQIVGTVSVSEYWGSYNSGWMHALAVDPQWRGRGVGGALVAGCGAAARGRRMASLEATLTSLQSAARRLLHRAGWETRGTYQRRLVGAALTLPVVHLGTDLPLAGASTTTQLHHSH